MTTTMWKYAFWHDISSMAGKSSNWNLSFTTLFNHCQHVRETMFLLLLSAHTGINCAINNGVRYLEAVWRPKFEASKRPGWWREVVSRLANTRFCVTPMRPHIGISSTNVYESETPTRICGTNVTLVMVVIPQISMMMWTI